MADYNLLEERHEFNIEMTMTGNTENFVLVE